MTIRDVSSPEYEGDIEIVGFLSEITERQMARKY